LFVLSAQTLNYLIKAALDLAKTKMEKKELSNSHHSAKGMK